MKRTLIVILGLALAAPLAGNAKKGLEIAKEIDRRDNGFRDSKADMVMTLYNKRGQKSVRYMRFRNLETRNDGDKSLTIFDRPRDVKGTALLTFSHKTGDDDQWLYLPALKRIKRISSSNKSGPFMGSEFAYEDIGSQEVEEYTYKYIKDAPCGGGLQCFVVERYPTYKNSGYKRQVTHVDKKEYRIVKTVFYDRKNAKLKTLTFSKYKKYLGKYSRAGRMFMENHQTGKSSEIVWKNYKFRNGYSKRTFDRSALKRAR